MSLESRATSGSGVPTLGSAGAGVRPDARGAGLYRARSTRFSSHTGASDS